MKTDTAYIIVYDWMAQAVGKECYLFALLCAYADAEGRVQMSRGYMAHRTARDVRAIDYELKALQAKGCIRKLTAGGAGRSDASTYEITLKEYKNLYPKQGEKSTKNCTLKNDLEYKKLDPKRVQKFVPNNNNLLNNSPALQESNTHTHEGMEDYGFSAFWELFKPAAEFTNLRRACCQAWAEATEPQREQMLAELRRNEPHRQNPLYHIRYFGENRASADAPELLTMQQVYARFNTTEPKGWCVLALEFEAPDKARWCKIEDAERKGYPIRRKWA